MQPSKERDIWLNGQKVGSIDETGDLEAMHLAAQALLESKGLRPMGKAEQLTALGQARSFGKVAQLLHRIGFSSHPYDPYLISPLIVCSVFSIEVFLKAIGQASGLKLTGHELSPLFDALPQAHQVALEGLFAERLKRHSLPPQLLRDVLAAMNRAFIEWRYIYEKDQRMTFELRAGFAALESLDALSTSLH